MMRKLFGSVLMATAFLFASCDFHVSDNGDLDGFWQLTDVDTLANGHSGDVRELQVFWSVQADLLEMHDIGDEHPRLLFRFKHEGDRLILSSPIANNRSISDSIVTDVNTISFYGLSHLTETLQVLQLTGQKMTLQSERLRMYFRKY